MSNRRIPIRLINDSIQNTVNDKRYFYEGIVKEVSFIDNKVKVEILPQKFTAWARVLFSVAEQDHISGSMPSIGSRLVLAALDSVNDPYENLVVIGCLFDGSNEQPTRETNGNEDKFYHSINPKNGGKIDLYKGNDGTHRLFIDGLGKINIDGVGDFNANIQGVTNWVCNDISLGTADLGDDNLLVTRKHLDLHDRAIDEIISLLNSLITSGFAGDLSIILPIAIRNPASLVALTTLQTKASLPANSGGIKENNTNKTTKTHAS
jgi:hypothetical protein